MSSIVDHLRCPICFEIPRGKVFQCKNGHTFCETCVTRLKQTCPHCRISLGAEKIRNRTLEQLLDVVEFSCVNRQLGCMKLLKRNQLTEHMKFCQFEPYFFCKLIGFSSCTYNADGYQALLEHLLTAHPQLHSYGTQKMLITHDNFFGKVDIIERGACNVWTPYIITLPTPKMGSVSFLFLCQISEVTQVAAWICLAIVDPSKWGQWKNDLQVEYTIGGSLNTKNELLQPKMVWKAPILLFKDLESDLETFALRIPLCVFKTFQPYASENNSLQVRLRLLDAKENFQGQAEIDYATIKQLTSFIAPDAILATAPPGENYEEQVVYPDVFCNACYLRPLTDIRYKCLQCIDYDLCKKCMEHRVHSHHVFARIQNLEQNGLLNNKQRLRRIKGKSSYI